MALTPASVLIVKVGVQGPTGPRGPKGDPGQGFFQFDTVAEMFAFTGAPGQIAFPLTGADGQPSNQHYKWDANQGTWIPAF